MKCPVCRAPYLAGQQAICRRCGADLTALIQIHDRAVWHYRQAIALCQAGDYSAAETQIQQAIALHARNAGFHAFDGQLKALQGKLQPAIAAWKQAQRLEKQNPIAAQNLELLAKIAQSDRNGNKA